MDIRFTKFVAVAALALMPLLTACSSSPETHLDWDVNDRIAAKRAPVRSAATTPQGSGPRVYVYQDPGEAIGAPPVPTPRPAYGVASNPRPLQASYRPVSPAPVGNASFAWPVNGEVIAGFGVSRTGERNDGINIAARHNAPIRAAAGGSVSYSGALNGYGNLLLVKHANGYVTAYAHADRLLVTQGDYVAKGQVIGYVGQTGDVAAPQLHFEIRSGTTPVNPERYLTARAGA
jgi:murein DD-endopeptidase MepM/ murein hydrolase activator NlpD